MVDYEERGGVVSEFGCVLADWGTAGVSSGMFYGGTPVYAGPRSFESYGKDLFSFGRLALELFIDEQGQSQKIASFVTENRRFSDSIPDWLYKCFFPQEDYQQLMTYRSQLTPFLKLIMKALSSDLENDDFGPRSHESLCNEIILEAQSLSANSSPQTKSNFNTLQTEHNQLKLNLK